MTAVHLFMIRHDVQAVKSAARCLYLSEVNRFFIVFGSPSIDQIVLSPRSTADSEGLARA